MTYLDQCNNQRQMFDHMMSQHPRRSQLQVYQMTSQQYIAEYPNTTYDCVYIDGEHSYSAVSMELNQYKSSTILCGDDWGPAHPGVTRAIDEFRSRHSDRTWHEPRLQLKSGFWKLIK